MLVCVGGCSCVLANVGECLSALVCLCVFWCVDVCWCVLMFVLGMEWCVLVCWLVLACVG